MSEQGKAKMTDLERIEAAIDGLKKQLDEMDGYADGYAMIFDGKHCTTILEALRFQKAAMGEVDYRVSAAGLKVPSEHPVLCPEPKDIFKAMIAELLKQVKENKE